MRGERIICRKAWKEKWREGKRGRREYTVMQASGKSHKKNIKEGGGRSEVRIREEGRETDKSWWKGGRHERNLNRGSE